MKKISFTLPMTDIATPCSSFRRLISDCPLGFVRFQILFSSATPSYLTTSPLHLPRGQVSSVQSLNCVRLFATPQTAAYQASLSITNSQSLLKLMSFKSVMPSNHLILCHPLLFLPSIFPSIRVFLNESVPRIRWPNYWSFSFNISPSNEYPMNTQEVGIIHIIPFFWRENQSPESPST